LFYFLYFIFRDKVVAHSWIWDLS